APVALRGVLAVLAGGLTPIRHVPSDTRIARFIEERVPALDDRLATAVDVVQSQPRRGSPILTAPFVADVARRAVEVDVNQVVPRDQLRQTRVRPAGATFVL